jgi:hypothetical protein
MQSMSGVPAAALCSVVHWFALSALAATPCLYPSVRQSRVKGQVSGQIGIYYYYYYYYFTYLPTYWISVLLRCAVRHPGWLARSLLPE